MTHRGDIDIGTSWNELVSMFIASLVIGFAISYRDWGIGNKFMLGVGFRNLLLVTFICVVTLWLRAKFQKIVARSRLATATFEYYPTNLIYTFFLSLITNGYFIFAAPGRPKIEPTTRYRPGIDKPSFQTKELAWVVASGSFASILLMIAAKLWLSAGGGLGAEYLLRTNIWMAIMTLIPLPIHGLVAIYKGGHKVRHGHTSNFSITRMVRSSLPIFEGEQIFFGSPKVWIFTAVSVILTAGLFKTSLGIVLSLTISVIVGLAAVIYWIYRIEVGGSGLLLTKLLAKKK